jgi:hypothetical protein
MITGIHINSTAPFSIRNKGADYYIEDFDLLTTILSALMWRKNNGSIRLYADKIGYDYYDSLELLDLWDGGTNITALENIPDTINQEIFWAAAKLFALQHEETPVAMIDTDLIVWPEVLSDLKDKQFAVIHREELHGCYPPHYTLKIRKDYQFDPHWDWSVLPCNMAFAYFSDPGFKKYYTDCAIDFMTDNNEYAMEMVSQMVFAEQRIVAICAAKMGIPIYHFLDDPFQRNNKYFSHIWGAKDIARNHPGQRKLLCAALLQKIKELFPAWYDKINETEKLRLRLNLQENDYLQ